MRNRLPVPEGPDLELACTGAEWLLAADGMLLGSALIPQRRRLIGLRLPGGRESFVVESASEEVIHAASGSISVQLHDDGLLVLRARRALSLDFDTRFTPEYVHRRRGEVFVADRLGGYALHLRGGGECRGDRWALAPESELWVSIFPPRQPRLEHLSWSIAHEGRPRPFPSATLPSDALIDEVAEHCQVLAVHAYFWRGVPLRERPKLSRYVWRRCAWRSREHVPVDPEGLLRVRERCTARGLKLLLYVSPLYSQAPDILGELERIHEVHGADGFYLDGLAQDLSRARALARGARRIVGDAGLLYLNSSEQPFRDPRLPCPLVDTHADFVLRGAAGRRGLPLRTFLRYAVSGWNLSQAVGVWCHYGSSGWPIDRVPKRSHVQSALAEHVRIWRRSHWSVGGQGLAEFDRQYESGLRDLARAERTTLGSQE